jgi:hypothetical protein
MLGFEGTPVAANLSDLFANGPFGDSADIAQPGTMSFVYDIVLDAGGNIVSSSPSPNRGPVCTRYENGTSYMIPGCRGPGPDYVAGTADDDPGFDPNVDGYGDPDGDGFSNVLLHPFFDPSSPFFRGTDSFTAFGIDQTFRSEEAAASFNLIMALVALSTPNASDGDPTPQIDEFDAAFPYRSDGCSYVLPHLCGTVSAFNAITGVQRNDVRAGGTANFGRRDFLWHGGQNLALQYEKRNVLGFSADFAEDRTKTNWGLEFTWIPGLPTANNDELDGLTDTDQFNLTVAIDRPTFVNFLNPNRTFFVTTQWFLLYMNDYEKGMPGTGR